MRCTRFLKTGLLVAVLNTVGLSAESTATTETKTEPKVEAKVDKTVAKPKQKIERFWITPEFLMMWSKDGPVKDLYVLQSNTRGSLALNNPNAQRLFSNGDQDYGLQLGGRLTFGMWIDDARQWGFTLSGFALGEKDASWTYTGSGSTASGVSILNTASGLAIEDSLVVNAPGSTGRIAITSSTQLWGAEGSGIWNFRRDDAVSLDFRFGVKHLDLSEDFEVNSRSQITSPFIENVSVNDRWKTHDGFYGAKVGMDLSMTCWNRLLLSFKPAISLGATSEQLEVRGLTRIEAGGVPVVAAGGLFTGSTNWGDYRRTKFAVAPEVEFGLGCKITKDISFNASYNFLYVSAVVRPGKQLNRAVNTDNLPPVSSLVPPFDPQPRFQSSDFWAHGVGVNLKIQF